MKAFILVLFASVQVLFINSLSSQNLYINEFLASNSTVIADDAGEYDDWVEIYNAGLFPVDIGGMYITDDLANPAKWQIPDSDPAETTIPAGGFLLMWFDGNPAQGLLHINTKLSANGEDIGIFTASGTQIDAISFGLQTSNISYGRSSDGGSVFQFFNLPTPGLSNNGSTGGQPVQKPKASIHSGFYNIPFEVTLITATSGAKIRYTLDGSEPTNTSQPYTGPIPVNQTTTLRAKAFAPGLLPSNTATYNYLFANNHTFPVVTLAFDNDDFFDPATGIYPNYEQNWERPVHLELFETNGVQVLNQEATVEIHGTGSASLPQKSLKVKALATGGSGFFEHPVFPDQPFGKYDRFLLRNSGQDWSYTMFHDAFVASLSDDLSDVGDIILPPRLFQQAFRPGVVYLNGEYWGIHNLREHMKSEYIEQHFGLSDNEIDLLDNDQVDEGTADNWNDLTNFLLTHDLSDDANLDQFREMVDLPHFLDYNVFNIIIDNSDWPGNNFRRWRDKNNGRWRFMTFDLDFTFGLYNLVPNGPTWNTGDASANSLARSLDGSQTTWPNPFWSTMYFRKPMENENFRRDYINRTADFLNVIFSPNRVNARLEAFKSLYLPEIQRHFDRWNNSFNAFDTNAEILRQFTNQRPQYIRQHVIEAFPEVNGTANITLQTDPAGAGTIEFSTLHLGSGHLPWSGEYFTGIPIPLTVIPAPGYVFEGWSDPTLENVLTTDVILSDDQVLTAYFQQITTTVENVVINEINYNSPNVLNSGDWIELYNPNDQTIDLSGWTLEDDGGGLFVIPVGTLLPPNAFLVVVENTFEFNAVHPSVNNVLGDFGNGVTGFKLSNDSDLISLKNASQVVIDTVQYDDGAPWPTEADGQGPTLQLIDPGLDNALAQSWIVQTGTPGKVNLLTLQPQTINFPPISDKFTNDQPFDITAAATSGLPVTFSITSGPATINGNTITLNGVVGLVFVQATQSGNSLWEAAPLVTRAFRVNEPPLPMEYCDAASEQPWQEWISRVKFAGIDHFSGKKTYSDFTDQTANAGAGETVSLTVEPMFSWQTHDEYIRAWIDFNQDFDFEDPGEMVLEASGTGQIITYFSIPPTAAQGLTRMRVALQRGQYAEPCDSFLYGEVEDYSVNIGLSNLPAQVIDFQAIPDQATSAPSFTVQAAATSGLPVSLNIISGPASVNGNVVTLTGAPGMVIIRATQAGNLQWQPASPVERSFTVTDAPQPPVYCGSSGAQPWLEWMERVEFGSIDHSSFKEQYGDFTHISTNAGIGETLTLQITPEFSWEVFEAHFRAWIDFNQDYDFDDPGEMVLEAIGTSAVSSDVLIPSSAVPGSTRLRISMQRGQFAEPCEDFLNGEVQDYEVVITNDYDNPNNGKILLLAPNPTGNDLNANFFLHYEGEMRLNITSADGVEFFSQEHFLQPGRHSISLDVSNLKSGLYMLTVQPEKQRRLTARFVKIEK